MAQPSGKIEINWELRDLDHNVNLLPQFPIENVSFTAGGVLSDQARHGFQDAITNWTRGKSKVISFETMVFAKNEEQGPLVQTWLDDIVSLSEKNADLGRPPICLFTLGNITTGGAYNGTVSSETVLVESADYVVVTTLRSGSPREVRFNIVLRRYVPFSQNQIDPTAPVKESFHLIASSAERSYEAIARRYYGDPLLGDRLRKRHPEKPFAPDVGQVVNIPSREIVMQEEVEPASHILSLTNEDAVDAFETVLEERNSRTVTVVK